jgi:hypothetical protein
MLFGLAHEFQERRHQLSGPGMGAGSAPETSVQLAQTELKSCWSCRTRTARTRNVQPGHLQHGRVRPVLQQASHLARGRTAGKRRTKRMTVAPDCQRNWYTAAETHHHSHSAEASSVPKNFKVESALNVHWYFNKTAWMLSTVFQDWLREYACTQPLDDLASGCLSETGESSVPSPPGLGA